MHKYFESEMMKLNEAAQDFAKAYPKQAAILNMQSLRDKNPYIERLLEGTAYLTAQIQKRLDDDLSEFSECFINHLWPEILKPYPSACIVQFSPARGQITKTYLLKKGASLISEPIGPEKIPCEFKTTVPIKINPLVINNIENINLSSREPCIRIHLEAASSINFNDLDLSDLEFYLHGESHATFQLYWLLTAEVQAVRVISKESEDLLFSGEQSMIQPCYLDSESSILSDHSRSFSGFKVLHDYFSFIHKFLFIKILDLNKIIWPKKSNACVIEIYFKKQNNLSLDFRANQLQLNCAPSVNLYSALSEPVFYTGDQYQQLLKPDLNYQEGLMIYSVDSVTGIDPRTLKNNNYDECSNISEESNHNTYQVKKYNYGKGREAFYLRLFKKQQSVETLSCELTVCNGLYPYLYIHENDVMTTGFDLPKTLQVKTLTQPSQLLSYANKNINTWNLIHHLALNRESLSSINNFKGLLKNYHWSDCREHDNRIEGLQKIKMQLKNKIQKGIFQQGVSIIIEVNEEYYHGFGDIYFFGTILHRFFLEYVAINWFVETQITCLPSNKVFLWQIQNGKLALI